MPRPPHTEPKVRLNLELTEKVRNRLEKVRILSEADSVTEVIRRALSIYDMLLNATQEHSKVILKDANGVEREILLIEAAVIRLPPKWTNVSRKIGFGVAYGTIQKRLNNLGFAKPELVVDGIWGDNSKAALMAFQRSEGLVADGIPGPITLSAMGLLDL